MSEGGEKRKLGKDGKEKVTTMPGCFVSCIFADGDLNLEEKLSTLTDNYNTCIIAVFECCRNAVARGIDASKKTGNYQFIFGCKERA